MIKKLLAKLRPIEISVLIYIGLAAVFIITFKNLLQHKVEHLTVRLAIILILGLFIQFNKYFSASKKMAIIRLFAPLLLLSYLYAETDYLNNLLFSENLDPYIVNMEQVIFGAQLSEKFSQLIPNNLFAELMYFGYFSYYLLIIGLPLLIYLELGKNVAEKVIFIIMNSFFIYYLLFIIFPVSGPQFYFENSLTSLPQGYIFGWAIRTLQHLGEAPTAAFPSSHVSICLMLVWLTYKYLKKFLPIVLPIAILLIFSTVYIKAHYAVDVIAAFITTPVILIISNKLFQYLSSKAAKNEALS